MKHPIDRQGKIPYYHQVAMSIEQRIASGEWPVGTKLPSELDLAEYYEVSRVTIRQSLTELEKDGIVSRERPQGTFVTRLPHKISPTIGLPATFVETLRFAGHMSNAETLSVAIVKAPSPEIAAMLKAEPDDQFIQYDRLVMTDGAPLAWAQSIIPYSRFPGLENMPLKNNSIHATIEEHFGASTANAEHWIEATMPTADDVRILQASVDRPILAISSVYYDHDEQPIGYMMTHWLGDLMKMHVQASVLTTTVVQQ